LQTPASFSNWIAIFNSDRSIHAILIDMPESFRFEIGGFDPVASLLAPLAAHVHSEPE
jgi:hypothetical protein